MPEPGPNWRAAFEAILASDTIAYRVEIARALHSVTACVLLSQMIYWTPRARDPAGWVYKTRDEWMHETGLGRYELDGARKLLRERQLIEEAQHGVPPVIHYRVDMERVATLIAPHMPAEHIEGNQQNGRLGSLRPMSGKPAELHTETTTETKASRDPKDYFPRTNPHP